MARGSCRSMNKNDIFKEFIVKDIESFAERFTATTDTKNILNQLLQVIFGTSSAGGIVECTDNFLVT